MFCAVLKFFFNFYFYDDDGVVRTSIQVTWFQITTEKLTAAWERKRRENGCLVPTFVFGGLRCLERVFSSQLGELSYPLEHSIVLCCDGCWSVWEVLDGAFAKF